LPDLAAISRYDADLFVAVDLAGERNPATVRRELGEQFDTGGGGQSDRGATSDRCAPQIAAVGEDHLVPVQIREAQQFGLAGKALGGEGDRNGNEGAEHSVGHDPRPLGPAQERIADAPS
jgi:hypothetical protein